MIRELDSGSFRDPAGQVFLEQERIYRELTSDGQKIWTDLKTDGIAEPLIESGKLVKTWVATAQNENSSLILEHEKIPFISYAYEWPNLLLKRAARLHLELMSELLKKGYILKDATPFNVQFRGCHPVFIDILSIQKHKAGDPWGGYGQFCDLMLYPLMLSTYKSVSFQSILKGYINGIPPETMTRFFSWFDLFKPGILTHVKLRALLHQKVQNPEKMKRSDIQSAGLPVSSLLRNVEGLKSIVDSLGSSKEKVSHWMTYANKNTYARSEMDKKIQAVEKLLNHLNPNIVWDIGCNTGEFSLLAAKKAEMVISFDNDEQVVEALAHKCEKEGIRNILPLVMDFTQPSPALGWDCKERKSIFERGKADVILALAVVHHMAVKGNIPLRHQLRTFSRAAKSTIVEYVDKTDPMFQRLQTNVDNSFESYSQNLFEKNAEDYFSVKEKIELSSTRSLYLLESKTI